MTGTDSYSTTAAKWRTIPEARAYEASEDGKILRKGKIRVRKFQIMATGYLSIRLSNGSHATEKMYLVHRLICSAFYGKCPKGHQCAHLNGNKLDVRLKNLLWVTKEENEAHKLLHGTRKTGTRQHQAVFKPKDLKEILRLKKTMSCMKLGKLYGVSHDTIWKMCSGKTYAAETSGLR